jgi:hypothetical protein
MQLSKPASRIRALNNRGFGFDHERSLKLGEQRAFTANDTATALKHRRGIRSVRLAECR